MISNALRNHFALWYQDLIENPQDYYLVLSDDLDSLLSCRFLMSITDGLEIGGFFSFQKGLYIVEKTKNKKAVYVDISVGIDGMMCFDNHRTVAVNHMMINPNVITDRKDDKTYFKKYNGSTLMLLVALYKPENLSEVQKEYLCAVDGFYMGYYRNNGQFKNINLYWLELLGLRDELEPVLEKHDNQFWLDYIAEHQLTEKIYIDEDGYLFTPYNLCSDILPANRFELDFEAISKKVDKDIIVEGFETPNYFGCVETFNNKYLVSQM